MSLHSAPWDVTITHVLCCLRQETVQTLQSGDEGKRKLSDSTLAEMSQSSVGLRSDKVVTNRDNKMRYCDLK